MLSLSADVDGAFVLIPVDSFCLRAAVRTGDLFVEEFLPDYCFLWYFESVVLIILVKIYARPTTVA